MKIKKRNIARAIDVAALSLLIYSFFQFVDGDDLYYFGNKLESFLHIHTNVKVEIVRTYLTTIFSGIFASTIVALGFFIVEFQGEKKEKILKLYYENNRLFERIMKIPYFDNKTEYGKLCIDYYLELTNNIASSKRKEEMQQIILSNLEKASLNRNICKTKLVKYLEQHKDHLRYEFDGLELSIEQKLQDIVLETHVKLKEALVIYSDVINEDLRTLKNCVFDISRISWLGYRKIKKVIGQEEQILRGLGPIGLFNRGAVEDRIYTLHRRVHERVKLIFEEVELNHESIEKYLINENVYGVLFEKTLVAQKGLFDYVYHEFFKGHLCYNRFAYHLAKLNGILLYDLIRQVDEISKYDFVDIRKSNVKAGRVLHSKIIPGEVIYGDLYRE
ncbi:CFAP97 domain-containing protein [Paenibacillus sp. P46E]|uniref:CFAP97 domain-containing protein n=1 Tax=Paenibacillus sp. P46E TaxID=1349436 RepID=UPI00093C35BC|nr:hypothetical protein [Paenibacillus sp. P46E]OKP98634.1 hypothetical protein A3849_08895 [Paenibacillus sp. P46E]